MIRDTFYQAIEQQYLVQARFMEILFTYLKYSRTHRPVYSGLELGRCSTQESSISLQTTRQRRNGCR